MPNNNQQIIHEDEIDLKELFKTIWNYKIFIVAFTLIITIVSILYVSFKPYTPIYQGKLLVEIGEIYDTDIRLIDNPNNLSIILEKELSGNISANIPRSTNNLIELTSNNSDKTKIENNINQAYEFVLNRHNEKVKNFDKYRITKKVGELTIENQPINKPKNNLIIAVSFVTSFILSIFLVFFREFIKSTFKS